jgi:hypothetical protein
MSTEEVMVPVAEMLEALRAPEVKVPAVLILLAVKAPQLNVPAVCNAAGSNSP